MNRTTILAASLIIAASLVSACGGSKQDAQQPMPLAGQGTVGYGQQPGVAPQPGYPAQPGMAPGAAPQPGYPAAPTAAPAGPAAAPTVDPNAQPAPQQPAAASNPLADQAVKLALSPRAASEAKGMKEDGAPVSGMLQEGQSLTQEFMLMPGKCYTILAQGLPPVAQVDMQLAAKPIIPAAPPMVLAASSTQGPNANIASGKNCYKNPFPIGTQVVLTVKASKGAGAVGAQVYSK